MNPVDNGFQDALSQGLFLILFALLGVTWGLYLAHILTKKDRYAALAGRMLWVCLAWNVGALIYRWAVAGHAPWANQYESATMVAFGVVALFTYFQREARLPLMGLLVLPAAMVVIAAANLLPQEYKHISPLMPALQSYWLKIHVSCMLVSYGSFACTFALSLLYLIRTGVWKRSTTWIALGIALLIGYFASYLTALSWADLTYVMPATAFGNVIVELLARFWLHETISWQRWLGVLLITLGVGFVAQGPASTTPVVDQANPDNQQKNFADVMAAALPLNEQSCEEEPIR